MRSADNLKIDLFEFCEKIVHDKLDVLRNNLKDVEVGLVSESKSSAGDKHETGRAMLQIEREKLGERLRQSENMFKILSSINPEEEHKKIGLGSLVFTSINNFYLAIPSGSFTNGKETVHCISLKSPIGRLLLGKQKGDIIEFRGEKMTILELE